MLSLATNQVDFAVPPRFNLTYVDRDGQEKTPLCLHRAPLGTHERFVGFLIEHYAGVFPVWLAPTQAMIIPIADRHVEYARQVEKRLTAEGMRVKVDDGTERMQNKIRKAQGMKIPYMLVVGDKEREADAVSLRLREMGRRYLATLLRVYGDKLLLSDDILAERLAARANAEQHTDRVDERLQKMAERIETLEAQLRSAERRPEPCTAQ